MGNGRVLSKQAAVDRAGGGGSHPAAAAAAAEVWSAAIVQGTSSRPQGRRTHLYRNVGHLQARAMARGKFILGGLPRGALQRALHLLQTSGSALIECCKRPQAHPVEVQAQQGRQGPIPLPPAFRSEACRRPVAVFIAMAEQAALLPHGAVPQG